MIGNVIASGNTSSLTSYSLIDETLTPSTAIYRLYEVDNDGVGRELASSSIPACASDASLNAYGDMNGDVVITLNSHTDEEYEVMLYDVLGKQMRAPHNISVVEGFNQFELSFGELAFATYYLYIVNESESLVKKIVIQ